MVCYGKLVESAFDILCDLFDATKKKQVENSLIFDSIWMSV